MKILFVFPYNPVSPTFGGALRIYHVLRHLCENHDVTVVGFSTPEKEQELIKEFPSLAGKTHMVAPRRTPFQYRWLMVSSLFSRHSHWYLLSRNPRLQQTIDDLLERERFDVIQCEFPPMAMYEFRSNAKRILDCHNVEYDNFLRMSRTPNLFKKLFYRLEAAKFRREELAVCSQQDALFVTSERDISILDASLPGVRKYLVPNGVDRSYFAPSTTAPVPHSMVFVGMMKYLPNHDGITWFLDTVFPKVLQRFPDAKITIVGKNPPRALRRRTSEQIIITGFVEDTRPYVDRASLYVVPLRMGGGTRLKILEALSMKKPIVATSIGAEGIDVENGRSIRIADDPDRFADAICDLFEHPEKMQSLTEHGDKLVDHYRWETIAQSMETAYKRLTRSSKQTDAETRIPILES